MASFYFYHYYLVVWLVFYYLVLLFLGGLHVWGFKFGFGMWGLYIRAVEILLEALSGLLHLYEGLLL